MDKSKNCSQNFNSEKYKMDCPEYKMIINIEEVVDSNPINNLNTEIIEINERNDLQMINNQQLAKQCYVVQTRRSNSLFVVDDDDKTYFKEIKK